MTSARSGSTESRRSRKVRASTEGRSAHCTSSTARRTGRRPAACRPPPASPAPTANGDAPEGTPPDQERPPFQQPGIRPLKQLFDDAIVQIGFRPVGARGRGATWLGQRGARRPRADFPIPDSPSITTSHGSPLPTRPRVGNLAELGIPADEDLLPRLPGCRHFTRSLPARRHAPTRFRGRSTRGGRQRQPAGLPRQRTAGQRLRCKATGI